MGELTFKAGRKKNPLSILHFALHYLSVPHTPLISLLFLSLLILWQQTTLNICYQLHQHRVLK